MQMASNCLGVDEAEFLASYDAKAFPPVAVAVDLVIVSVIDKQLAVLLIRRSEHPAKSKLALPGSIVQADEDLEACAVRTARAKVGGSRFDLRQFAAFGDPLRDPRMRVISIGYLALTSPAALRQAAEGDDGQRVVATIRVGEQAISVAVSGRKASLAFDHDAIVAAAVRHLQNDLERDLDIFPLLPDEFTILDLQTAIEAIKGKPVNKTAFRKSILGQALIEAVGRTITQGAYRPAMLYRHCGDLTRQW